MRHALIFLVLLATAAAGQSNELAEIVELVSSSVVTINSAGVRDGEIVYGQGSGFLIEGGWLVTNHHVLDSKAVAAVDLADGRRTYVDRVVAWDTQSDLVVATIAPKLSIDTPALVMSDSLPHVGDAIVVFGSPEGFSRTVTHGIVSAIRDRNERTFLQIDAAIAHGSSGGPVVAMDGRVVGISTLFVPLTHKDPGRPSDIIGSLNFAVSAVELTRLAGEIGVGAPLAEWSGQSLETVTLPIAQRLGEVVPDTVLTALRSVVLSFKTVKVTDLIENDLLTITDFFRAGIAEVSGYRWGPTLAPTWHPRHKSEWFTLFHANRIETAYVDSAGSVMWWEVR